mgnify:CR=1 FL=1
MSDESKVQSMLNSLLDLLNSQRLVILDKDQLIKVLLNAFELLVNLTAKVGDMRAILVQVGLLFDHVQGGESMQGRLDGHLKASL